MLFFKYLVVYQDNNRYWNRLPIICVKMNYIDNATTFAKHCSVVPKPCTNCWSHENFTVYAEYGGLVGWFVSESATEQHERLSQLPKCPLGTMASYGNCFRCAAGEISTDDRLQCDACWSMRTNDEQSACIDRCADGEFEIASPDRRCSTCDFETAMFFVFGCPLFSTPNYPMSIGVIIIVLLILVAFFAFVGKLSRRHRHREIGSLIVQQQEQQQEEQEEQPQLLPSQIEIL